MNSYNFSTSDKKNILNFINELNLLLRDNNLNIDFTDGALFSNTLGYIGVMEDNRDSIAITDGSEHVFVSETLE